MELNEKLARWAGFTSVVKEGGFKAWYTPEGIYHQLDFTDSLDACFRRLVPRIVKDYATELVIVFEYLPNYDSWTVAIEDGFYEHGETKRVLSCASGKELTLALCLAVEKLIKEEK